MTKIFFDVAKEKPTRTILSELQTNNGSKITGDVQFEEECVRYYQQLYDEQERSVEAKEAENEILDVVPRSIMK